MSHAQRRNRLYALASACLAIIAALAAVLARYNSRDPSAAPSTTLTVLAMLITVSVAATAAAFVIFESRRRFEAQDRVLDWRMAPDLDGRLVEQDAQIISDVLPYLSDLPPLGNVLMVGYAGILLELLNILRPQLMSRRQGLRVVLMEDESLFHSLRDYVRSSWKPGQSFLQIRCLEHNTSAALIMTPDMAFYGGFGVPGPTDGPSRWSRRPWIAMSVQQSGPLWVEWEDEIERIWHIALPVEE